jgi:hypothetical protein
MKRIIILLALVGLLAAACNQKTAPNNTTTPATNSTSQGIIYKNSDFHFHIYKPDYASVQATSSSNDQISCCGRLGSVRIPIKSNDTFVDIFVYNNQANLEKDHSSATITMDNGFKEIGLMKATKTINGKQVPVYYGLHIVDSPGGGDPWPDVEAEFVGSTYSYMVDIVNVSSDPNNSEVLQYLNSFKAD